MAGPQACEAAHLAAALMDSEFINSLSNPQQLFHLSNSGHLTAPFLQRLQALHAALVADPLRLATLRHPQALEFLHLLWSSARFREQLKNPAFVAYLERAQTEGSGSS
jgi:hypothetical protein